MSNNDGHRQRLKERFELEGLDHFQPYEVLELLLFYCIPRKDTKPIAKALIERFGSVEGVLSASPAERKKVEGVGDGISVFLSLLSQLQRYYHYSDETPLILDDLRKCGDHLVRKFVNYRNEVVLLLCLDAKCKVLACYKVGEGSVNSAAVPIRRIVEMAMDANATTVVLAHNHPSGLALPSKEDCVTTRKLALALHAVEIELSDHIVVADDDYVSMRLSGMYDPRDCLLPI